MINIKIKNCLLLFVFFSVKLYSQTSVLATGNWYKLSVTQDGIYCITASDLAGMGINLSSIDPRNISLYGNKTGMLPVENNVPHKNDLQEMAIEIKGEVDGSFDPGDTIFFYGQSPVERTADLNTLRFSHKVNIYSDSTYYFLTVGTNPGKRIGLKSNQPTFTNSISNYSDLEWHEMDSVNFLHSGKSWYGETINANSSRVFHFDISNISNSDSLFIKTDFISRTFTAGSIFTFTSNGFDSSQTVNAVGSAPQDPYAIAHTWNLIIPSPVNNGDVQLSYQSADSTARSYLNYIEINFKRDLYIFRPQQLFCDLYSVGTGNVTHYLLNNAQPSIQVWDVTDPLNPSHQLFSSSVSTIEFNASNDSAHTYMAFDGHSFLIPKMIGAIPNQNLHSFGQADMLIITAREFKSYANTLAAFHQSHDGLHTLVADVNEIYNEYSSGSKDPVAIRDLIRQVYGHSGSNNDSLKYLLLFGDASFDFKNHLGFNGDFVPTYETDASLNQTTSYAIDNFFGFMDDSASDYLIDRVNIGIGRLPIKNITEAQVAYKIMDYESFSFLEPWRKEITMVCDDGANNIFLRQTDTISNRLENDYCGFDMRKIYLDEYTMDTTGGHISYPSAVSDIESNIKKGCLAIQYCGFGGTLGWAHERILTNQFIDTVHNYSNLPLFLHWTSDINKFDDPADTSCGEKIIIATSGGGIASIGSSRLAFSSSTYNFEQAFNKFLFEKENNNYFRLGDIMKKTRQSYNTDLYVSHICLLGDPAVRLNYPENDVVTTSFNSHSPSQLDSLVPGQTLQIDGEIHDANGNLISSFNGIVYILIYDQKTLHYTLANDPSQSSVEPFYAWDDTIYYTSVPVTNGTFSLTYNLPWNLDSGSGIGKISYYAKSSSADASGCFQNYIYKNLYPGIEELPGVSVKIYPNPSQENMELSIEGIKVNNFNFILSDASGKLVRRVSLNTNVFIIERNSLAAGTYFYKIETLKKQLIGKGRIAFEK